KERGFLREGYWADLVLVDDAPLTVRREDVLSRCGWSPFESSTFRSRIGATWVNGRMVWDGRALVGAADGQRLEFARCARREQRGRAVARQSVPPSPPLPLPPAWPRHQHWCLRSLRLRRPPPTT